MCPVFYRLGGTLIVSSWMLMYLLAILAGMWASIMIDRRVSLGIGWHRLIVLWLCVVCGPALLGGAIFQMGVLWISGESTTAVGKAYYGGVALVLVPIFFVARFWRLSTLRLFDVVVLGGSLAGAIGRIGCFLNGCCRGDVAPAWIPSIHYPHNYLIASSPTIIELATASRWQEFTRAFEGSTPVHPTPIYYSLGFLAIFVFLWTRSHWMKESPGRVFYVWLIAHGLLRFLLELIRDNPPYLYGKVNLSGVVSIVCVAIGVTAMRRRKNRPVLG